MPGLNIASSPLSTDYLNHFNEVVMLLEMLPVSPDLVEDVLAWEPRGYEEHFRRSSFKRREEILEAHAGLPEAMRQGLEDLSAEATRLVVVAQGLLRRGLDAAGIASVCEVAVFAIHTRIARLDAFIARSGEERRDPEEVRRQRRADALLGPSGGSGDLEASLPS